GLRVGAVVVDHHLDGPPHHAGALVDLLLAERVTLAAVDARLGVGAGERERGADADRRVLSGREERPGEGEEQSRQERDETERAHAWSPLTGPCGPAPPRPRRPAGAPPRRPARSRG